MIQPKQIAWFFIQASLIYLLLIPMWPGLHTGYGTVVRAGCTVITGEIGSTARVTLLPLAADKIDLRFGLEKRAYHRSGIGLSSRNIGYLPMALLLALVLSTPIPWKRRIKALLWSVMLFHVIMAFRIAFSVYSQFVTNEKLALIQLGTFWKYLVFYLDHLMVNSVTTSFTISLIIWMVVSFRRDDWTAIAQSIERVRTPPSETVKPEDIPD
jgi:hypothetical protein